MKKARSVIQKLKKMRLTSAAKTVSEGVDETLGYLLLPPRALASYQNQQPAGEDHQGDSAKNQGCGRLPGWGVGTDAVRG